VREQIRHPETFAMSFANAVAFMQQYFCNSVKFLFVMVAGQSSSQEVLPCGDYSHRPCCPDHHHRSCRFSLNNLLRFGITRRFTTIIIIIIIIWFMKHHIVIISEELAKVGWGQVFAAVRR